jgi:hypothetical protein
MTLGLRKHTRTKRMIYDDLLDLYRIAFPSVINLIPYHFMKHEFIRFWETEHQYVPKVMVGGIQNIICIKRNKVHILNMN